MQRWQETGKEDESPCRSEIWIYWEGNPPKCNTGSRIERLFLAIMLLSTGLVALRVADFAKSRMAGSRENSLTTWHVFVFQC